MNKAVKIRILSLILALCLVVGMEAAAWAQDGGQDAGNGTNATENASGDGDGNSTDGDSNGAAGTGAIIITAFHPLGEAVSVQGYDPGAIAGEAELNLPGQLEAEDNEGEPITVAGVTWELADAAAVFDPAQPGIYSYTAVLPEGYEAAEGVTPPEIRVIVRGGIMPTALAVGPYTTESELRTAITNFNTSATDDTTITVNGTIVIDTALPDITNSTYTLTLTGGRLERGAALAPLDPLLKVDGGVLTLENITLDGQGDPGDYTWSLVNVDGSLTIKSGAVLQNNNAGVHGGAVRVTGGTLVMEGGLIHGNASQFGGGVYVGSGTLFTMQGGSISGNNAFYHTIGGGGEGGGVYVSTYGSFNMEDGAITGNTAEADGGGVENFGGVFTMSGGTITGNAASGDGGGVMSINRTFSMIGGEISGNTAPRGSGVYSGWGNTFTMTGGLIYDRGDRITDVVHDDTPTWAPTGHGIVVCWTGANSAQAIPGQSTELEFLPAGATVRWEVRGGVRGIAYEVGGISGFIPVSNISTPSIGSTSTPTPSRDSGGGTTTVATAPKRTVAVEHLGGYRFQVDLPLLGFVAAYVDGELLTRGEDYTLRSSSTILTLTDSYVGSLASGTHTLRMEFLSATATTDFTVTSTGGSGVILEGGFPAIQGAENDNMNPSTGGVERAGSIAVLLAVLGLWTAAPKRFGK